ncbi:MAG: hypothetical protein GY938_26875 [Ketobacter sp.]|nr:hypothetical protein [Ketobacter sp.]
MAAENLLGSRVMTGLDASPQERAAPGVAGGVVKVWQETVEVTAAAEANSTYLLARLPSNVRILSQSTLHWDDLDGAGAPTLDIGCFNVGSETNFTDDADALNDALDPTSAGSGNVLKTVAQFGIPLWDNIASVTEDPQCLVDVKVSLVDAAGSLGGTLYIELFYTVN